MTRYTYRRLRSEYLKASRVSRMFPEHMANEMRLKARMQMIALRVAYYY